MRTVPQIASPRIQHWAMMLRVYEYSIVYKVGQENNNADALSRLPLADGETKPPKEDQERVLMLDDSDTPLVTAGQVRQWTDRDTVLSRICDYVLRGWPRKVNESAFNPYTRCQEELSIQDGCVLWGARVVIPQQGRAAVLQQLHQAHPGITRMNGLTQSYIWWPNLDSDIENIVKTCEVLGTVEKRTSPVSYSIAFGSGKMVRRHIDQVRCRHSTMLSRTPDMGDALPDEISPPETVMDTTTSPPEKERANTESKQRGEGFLGSSEGSEQSDLRRSQRIRSPPLYLKDYI
ncbi:hypothetical protein AOLI_G00310370 [Acnodon oligacanthus]